MRGLPVRGKGDNESLVGNGSAGDRHCALMLPASFKRVTSLYAAHAAIKLGLLLRTRSGAVNCPRAVYTPRAFRARCLGRKRQDTGWPTRPPRPLGPLR